VRLLYTKIQYAGRYILIKEERVSQQRRLKAVKSGENRLTRAISAISTASRAASRAARALKYVKSIKTTVTREGERYQPLSHVIEFLVLFLA
jgi:hypothetical protein